MATEDDEAWRAIVDNYGERPALDLGPDPEAEPDPEPSSDYDDEPEQAVAPVSAWTVENVDADWTTDRFVPPPPPPVPRTTPDRLAAWAGVFGSPLILLVCLILHIGLPRLIAYLLVIGFVGGFVYLVIQMPREPRDPDDNGAVL